MTRHWWLTTQVIEVTHPARMVLVPTSGSNTVTEPWLPLLQHWFAYLHLTVSVLTCAGVWMIATLSKVTIPPTPGRLSTIHPSWDLSVVWQSTRVWWGSMLGELASTKLMSDMFNCQEKWKNNTQIFNFYDTSSEPQYCLVLLHFDKLTRLAQLETGRPHPCHGWTPRVCCWSWAGFSWIWHKYFFTKPKQQSLLKLDILRRFL